MLESVVPIIPRLAGAAALSVLLGACAMQPGFEAVYQAEQGNYDAALVSARAAQGNGIDGLLLGNAESRCADYSPVLTVLVAKGDFAGAAATCQEYSAQCTVETGSRLCFAYERSALLDAGSDPAAAQELSENARELLHFRWLMIRDDYEGRDLKRPIY